ncbi:MAG: HAD family phosphatase [Clostridia bacterium]|nr:HAD family phosphatase [Clostridia bacterium]
MIKLIASDLDGTLLLPDGSLPEETLRLIERLFEKGVLFCVASGRQYESVKRLFAPVADKIVFIAENGALVYYKGELLYDNRLTEDVLPTIFAAVRAQKDAYPLLCCAENAYAEDDYAPFFKECAKYYPNFKRVNKFEDALNGDPVCKVAVFDDRGAAEHSGKTLPALLPDFRVIVSGKVWSDISMPEVNKGNAMKFIQQHFGFLREECVAFGDYMNDLELLLAVGHPFVTANGFDGLKEKIGYERVILSNAEKGVIQKMEELLRGEL